MPLSGIIRMMPRFINHMTLTTPTSVLYSILSSVSIRIGFGKLVTTFAVICSNSLSAWTIATSDILVLCDQLEMRWSDTGAIPAKMIDLTVSWNRSIQLFPEIAMCSVYFV